MASVAISGLPSTSTVDPTNAAIPVTNSGTTYKATPTVIIGSALGSPPPIGNTTPNTGSFSTMTISGAFSLTGGQVIPVANGGTGSGTASGARTNLGLGTISTQSASSVAITGGSIDNTTIGGNTAANATFNVVNVNSYLTLPVIQPINTSGVSFEDTSNNVLAVYGASNSTNVSITPPNGVVTLNPTGTGSVVINSGGPTSTIDNVTIGGTTPRAGTFVNLQANNSVYAATVRPLSASGALSLYNSAGTAQLSIPVNGGVSMTGNRPVNISPAGSVGSLTINPAGGGNIDNVVIGETTPVAGTFDTLNANNTVTLSPENAVVYIAPYGTSGGVIIDPSNGGTMDNVLIGGTTPTGATFTSVSTTSLAATSGTVTNAPVNTNDIVNKAYVDSVAVGLQPKAPVQALAASNITLSGLQTIDGYTTVAGDRIIVTGQTQSYNNGIYAASTTAWTRTSDANTWNLLIAAFAQVLNGTLYKGTGWVSNAKAGGTLGVTGLNFFPFTATQFYTAGTGLNLNGNQFNISNTGVIAGGYGSSSTVPYITLNAQGQVTAASSQTINITLSQVSGAGTIASQNASSVAVTGGYIDGTEIGATTASSGKFTTLTANTSVSFGNGSSSIVWNGVASVLTGASNFTGLTGGNLVYFTGDNTVNSHPQLTIGANDVAGVITLNTSSISGTATADLLFSMGGVYKWAMGQKGDFFGPTSSPSQTTGFIYIPAAAGVPTGTPTGANGNVPLYYDTTDGALYAYNGAWQSINFQPNQLEARAAPMTIANTTDTAVLWTTVDVNGTKLTYASGKWTNSSSRALTVIISTTIAWDNVSGGARAVYITRNGDSTTGTNRMAEFDVDAGTTDFDVQNVNTTIALQPNDYFQVWVWQNSGSNVGIGNASGGMNSGYSVRLQATVL